LSSKVLMRLRAAFISASLLEDQKEREIGEKKLHIQLQY
jgi:hypothetical protein